MRLPENPSVLAQVKVMMTKLPLGTSLTLHDLMRSFPSHDENNLSATFHSLISLGCMEKEDGKVFSQLIKKDGKMIAGNLTSYKLVSYPDTGLHSKPVFKEKVKQTPEPVSATVPAPVAAPVASVQKTKFDKVFACNPNIKFDVRQIECLGNELIYLCDHPMYDGMTEEQSRIRYEWTMVHRLRNFNPDRDVVAIYGDPMIGMMAMFYLGSKYKKVNIARFSARSGDYVNRTINLSNFII